MVAGSMTGEPSLEVVIASCFGVAGYCARFPRLSADTLTPAKPSRIPTSKIGPFFILIIPLSARLDVSTVVDFMRFSSQKAEFIL